MPARKSGASGKPVGRKGPNAKPQSGPKLAAGKSGNKRSAAMAEKQFGKAASSAAKRAGKKPTVWKQVEERRPDRIITPQAQGDSEVHVTRLIEASASEVFRAFNDPMRRGWCHARDYLVRTAIAPRFLRLAMADGTEVVVSILRKGNVRCSVELHHTRLTGTQSGHAHTDWRDALGRLGEMVAE